MIEALIKDSLIRLSTATQTRGQGEDSRAGQPESAATQAQQIAREIDTLDALLAEKRHALHPQLVHFLANRSYAKALSFLGGETGEIPAAAKRKVNEENT